MYEIESGIKAPRIKTPKCKRVPDSVTKGIEAYRDAYKAVYGIRPSLVYSIETGYISDGKTSVKLKRLKEMTRMLKARVD